MAYLNTTLNNNKHDNNVFNDFKNTKILVLRKNNSNNFLYKILSDNYNLNICYKFNYDKFDLIIAEIYNDKSFNKIIDFRKNNIVPFVCISENLSSDYKFGAYQNGINLFIEKPYDINLVHAQIFGLIKQEHERKILQAERDDFVASITHDLKSPLNAQKYALNSLFNSHESLSDYQKEVLNDLMGSIDYMKILTENILTKYKNDDCKLQLNKTQNSFKNLVEKCISELKYITKSKQQKISFHSNNTIEGYFDYTLIRRVLNNLISNASEYTPQNGFIDILAEDSPDKIIFKIKDNGYGIENPETIFEKYVSHAQKNKKIGYGLGLHICKQIIDAHNGKISISSELNKGTLISFYLPKIYH